MSHMSGRYTHKPIKVHYVGLGRGHDKLHAITSEQSIQVQYVLGLTETDLYVSQPHIQFVQAIFFLRHVVHGNVEGALRVEAVVRGMVLVLGRQRERDGRKCIYTSKMHTLHIPF